MKYRELTGWKRLIAEACRESPELIAELNKLLQEGEQHDLCRDSQGPV